MEWVTRQEMKIEYGGGHTGLLLCIRKDPPHAAFDDRCDTTRLSHVRRRCGEARRRCSARDRGPDSGMRAAQLSVPAVIEDFRFVTDSPLEEARFEPVWGFSCQVVVFGFLPVLCSEVCPGKASMFSRRQSCRGKSQSPVVWIAEEMETEPSKPIDKISRGEITSHRAVSKENALWPRKK